MFQGFLLICVDTHRYLQWIVVGRDHLQVLQLKIHFIEVTVILVEMLFQSSIALRQMSMKGLLQFRMLLMVMEGGKIRFVAQTKTRAGGSHWFMARRGEEVDRRGWDRESETACGEREGVILFDRHWRGRRRVRRRGTRGGRRGRRALLFPSDRRRGGGGESRIRIDVLGDLLAVLLIDFQLLLCFVVKFFLDMLQFLCKRNPINRSSFPKSMKSLTEDLPLLRLLNTCGDHVRRRSGFLSFCERTIDVRRGHDALLWRDEKEDDENSLLNRTNLCSPLIHFGGHRGYFSARSSADSSAVESEKCWTRTGKTEEERKRATMH